MTSVKVELPEDFSRGLTETIKQSAIEAFSDLRKQTERYPEYMTLNEACSFMNVSRSTLQTKFIPAGLRIIQVDKLMRVSKKECIRFLTEHEI